MANDLNQCNFIGRLAKEPEVRYLPNGEAVASFTIAVGESWKDKASGDTNESVEWVRCTAWRRLAEVCGEYLKKGQQVFISGKMKTRKWTDNEGRDRYSTEIHVERMQMLAAPRDKNNPPPPGEEDAPPARKTNAPSAGKRDGGIADMENDIPF